MAVVAIGTNGLAALYKNTGTLATPVSVASWKPLALASVNTVPDKLTPTGVNTPASISVAS